MTRAEWQRRSDFAEFAEVLDVTTDAIMAVHQPQGDSVLVLFSPDVEHEPRRIVRATLERSVDGTLFEVERAEMPGFWEQLERKLKP